MQERERVGREGGREGRRKGRREGRREDERGRRDWESGIPTCT